MRYSFVPSAAVAVLSAASLSSAATVCNGYAELCAKPYSGVSVVGAHNSYTASNTNLAANQDYGVTQQLTDGVRLLQNQVHNQNGQLTLCHTTCLLYNGGLLVDYLKKVKTWMDSNPNEVVTILLVNIDNQPASAMAAAYTAAGLDKISYKPPQATMDNDAWPTYGALIDAGTPLVTFMDNTADFTGVPYIIDEFSNMWESHFDVRDPPGFNCSIDRFTGTTDGQMYLINHYLYTTSNFLGGSTPVPDKAKLEQTNGLTGANSLGDVAENICTGLHGRPPTFLLVDFYEWGQGTVFEVAAKLNGVQYQAKSIAAQNGTDGNTGSGTPRTGTNVTRNDGLPSVKGAIGAPMTVILGMGVAMGAFVGSLVAL